MYEGFARARRQALQAYEDGISANLERCTVQGNLLTVLFFE